MFSYKHKTPKHVVYKSLNKEVVSVPHYIEETFFDVSNWKLPLRVRLPTSPFSNVDNELIAKTSTLKIKIKRAVKLPVFKSTTIVVKVAQNLVFHLLEIGETTLKGFFAY